ncbi:MAG: HdaA/DnaA family protein [Wenzhouxiangella sp.]
MTSVQIPLALKPPRRPSFDNFIAGPNQAVVDTLAGGLEPGQWYFLAGPAGSGRSHLLAASFSALLRRGLQARFLAMASSANWPLLEQTEGAFVLLDDIDALAGDAAGELVLFNALNRWRAQRSTVLLSGVGRAGFQLPDLASRLGQAVRLTLKPLEDVDLAGLVQRLAREHEVVLGRGAAEYLITRSSRNPAALARLFEQLAARALSERRTLSIPLIREDLAPGKLA